MLTSLESVPLRQLAWILPIGFALHELEEWYILDWYVKYWNNLGDLSSGVVRIWLVFISLVGFVNTWIATLFRRDSIFAGILLFVFAFAFLHGLLHVHWLFYFKAYSPGVVTSFLVLFPTYLLFAVRAVRGGAVKPWFIGVALLLNLPPVIAAIRMGDTLPEGGLPFYRLSGAIVRLFGDS